MENRKILFSPPDISDLEINEVVETLKSGWITTGIRTKLFEQKISEYLGTTKTVCLSSATAALELTLRILGIGPGDEVITSAYTYTASASVVEHIGAKLVMIDTSPNSFEMDYEKLSDAITDRTKAIIPVDIGGRMCDYDRIFSILEGKRKRFVPTNQMQQEYGRVIVVADSAHGFGAWQRHQNTWKTSGQVADFTCFSFHAVKNLTTGEGGAVTWSDHEGIDPDWLYHEYMLMSLHGQNKDAFSKNQIGAWEYDIIYLAYKCNMTDIQAAIGIKQLERYEKLLDRRRQIVQKYNSTARLIGAEYLNHLDEENRSSMHLYLMRIPGIGEKERNNIILRLAEQGIGTNVHYKPLPMMTAYKNAGFSIKDFPNAFSQYKNEITLPLHTSLSNEDVDYICECLKNLSYKMGETSHEIDCLGRLA